MKGVVRRLLAFLYSFEVLVPDEWKVVIRYDCAHGFSHIDQYWHSGRKKKVRLNLDFEKALILANWDIKTNWQKYVSMYFGKGE